MTCTRLNIVFIYNLCGNRIIVLTCLDSCYWWLAGLCASKHWKKSYFKNVKKYLGLIQHCFAEVTILLSLPQNLNHKHYSVKISISWTDKKNTVLIPDWIKVSASLLVGGIVPLQTKMACQFVYVALYHGLNWYFDNGNNLLLLDNKEYICP